MLWICLFLLISLFACAEKSSKKDDETMEEKVTVPIKHNVKHEESQRSKLVEEKTADKIESVDQVEKNESPKSESETPSTNPLVGKYINSNNDLGCVIGYEFTADFQMRSRIQCLYVGDPQIEEIKGVFEVNEEKIIFHPKSHTCSKFEQMSTASDSGSYYFREEGKQLVLQTRKMVLVLHRVEDQESDIFRQKRNVGCFVDGDLHNFIQ